MNDHGLHDSPPDKTWTRIGVICSAGRRSLWFRENEDSFELRAGREGDDFYVRVTKENPQYQDLLDIMTTARFAAET